MQQQPELEEDDASLGPPWVRLPGDSQPASTHPGRDVNTLALPILGNRFTFVRTQRGSSLTASADVSHANRRGSGRLRIGPSERRLRPVWRSWSCPLTASVRPHVFAELVTCDVAGRRSAPLPTRYLVRDE